jgi:hypothetical protein
MGRVISYGEDSNHIYPPYNATMNFINLCLKISPVFSKMSSNSAHHVVALVLDQLLTMVPDRPVPQRFIELVVCSATWLLEFSPSLSPARFGPGCHCPLDATGT